MSKNTPYANLAAVIRACQEEAQQARRQEQGHCFELFRRALDEGDQAAWQAVQAQYYRLILTWLYDRRPAGREQDDVEELAQETLTKFWRSLHRRPEGVQGRFPHVGALLKYLYQCAVTSLLDRKRHQQRQARLQERLQNLALTNPGSLTLEERTLHRLSRADQMAQVRAWIAASVTDPDEKLILALTYEANLTPAQIAERHDELFADAAAVRRIKERLLKRARRALAQNITGAD